MVSRFPRRRAPRNDEGGYILMILLLAMALIAIFAAASVQTIKFQIQRDREEELIHRGVQYSRAIRSYYKKFGRYPAKLEDLEHANNLKFLRKRYKDPVTGQDFRLLHIGEVKLMFGGGGVAATYGASAPGMGISANPGGLNSTLNGNTGFSGNAGNLPLGSNQGLGQTPGAPPNGTDPSQPPPSGTDPNNPSGDNSGTGNSDNNSATSGQGSQQTFGGMPIVGVASYSKKETIREFNHKKKYNEWQFIYDPGTDRGGLLMTPNQPPLIQQQTNVNGQNGSGNNTGFGNNGGFGTSQFGLQNNQNPPSNGPPANSNDSGNPPQQQ